ncbi:AAA family ATPase [Achromobacter xylosoxidans]
MNPNEIPIFTPDDSDFRNWVADSDPQTRVVSPSAWTEQLVRSTMEVDRIFGARLPWKKTHDQIRFRPEEVSLWQGINGHGKSQLLGQVSLGLAAQDEPVCLASFEMKPLTNLKRMLRQVARNATPSAQIARRMLAWMEGRFWFYDQAGMVRPEMIYKVVAYAAQRLGCKHIVIDSLMKCVRGEEDKDGQKNFLDMLTALARDNKVHVHLVHHVRKGENEDKAPGKFDARGSAAIIDQVDNILTVWRNKPKERIAEKEARNGGEVSDETNSKPDTYLICDKQRNGEWEGSIGLWFHPDSMQFTPDKHRRPMELVGELA